MENSKNNVFFLCEQKESQNFLRSGVARENGKGKFMMIEKCKFVVYEYLFL